MKAALCQLIPKIGDVRYNTDIILRTMGEHDADVFIFPEMFLTDYTFTDLQSVKDDVESCIDLILSETRCTGKTAIFGGPRFDGETVYNAAYVVSDKIEYYDKINLPNFPPFKEKETFARGSKPFMTDICGFRFGIIVCYDIFFPELTKMYAMNGADAVICISASPKTSNTPFERVVPARSVESTVYMLFVNNTGTRGQLEFFGKSRCLTPTGDTAVIAGSEESVLIAELDRDSIDFARIQRPTLADTRVWMHVSK